MYLDRRTDDQYARRSALALLSINSRGAHSAVLPYEENGTEWKADALIPLIIRPSNVWDQAYLVLQGRHSNAPGQRHVKGKK